MTGVAGLASGLNVRNMTDGTLVALSLDGLPLAQSRRFMVKMETDARNVDEIDGPDPRSKLNKTPWRVDVLGSGPVDTRGTRTTTPLEVYIGRRQILQVYLERGSFDLLVDGDSRQFYCDTPGTRFELCRDAGASAGGGLQQVGTDGNSTPLETSNDTGGASAVFPALAALVRTVG
jgi:hypothetical protein